MRKILVTGASGFVGQKLCRALQKNGWSVRMAVQDLEDSQLIISSSSVDPESIVVVGDIGLKADWSNALRGVDVVVHLAARVHVLREKSNNPIESFRSVNVRGTEYLANMAAESGVGRFVFVSSIGVHGNETKGKPFDEQSLVAPHSPYTVSKWEAELALQKLACKHGFDLVVVRPPLVYGPKVGGNFLRLLKLLDKGIPLPLGSVENLRSFIGIDNLIDLLIKCADHPKAANEIFLAADGDDLSTPALLQRLSLFLGRHPRIWPFPIAALQLAASIFGRVDAIEGLCNSLQVNAEKAKTVLGWRPLVPLDDGLECTVRWFFDEYKSGATS